MFPESLVIVQEPTASVAACPDSNLHDGHKIAQNDVCQKIPSLQPPTLLCQFAANAKDNSEG